MLGGISLMIRRFLGRSGVLGCQQPRAAKPALPCVLVTVLGRGQLPESGRERLL